MQETSFTQRYNRHIMLPKVGEEGQRKLLQSHVLVVGAGGLGSPVTMYLVAAGVGHLVIVDNDQVDFSNLQRQIIHTTGDVGRAKVASAQEKLNKINPDVEVVAHRAYFNSENALSLIAGMDVVVDCTDNVSSKFLINDICVNQGVSFVHGAVNGFSGNVMTVIPGSATLRDLFVTEPQPTGKVEGILGVVPGIIGTVQAAEVVKLLLGIGDLLVNQVLTFDALTMDFMKFKVGRRCQ